MKHPVTRKPRGVKLVCPSNRDSCQAKKNHCHDSFDVIISNPIHCHKLDFGFDLLYRI